jgi:uncharacterized protein YgbK (DUF1537 family)
VVIDTETRHVSPQEARERCRRAAESISAVEALYVKTDSTLRGPIAQIFRGVLDVFRPKRIVYAPAYPRHGRTVAGGVLYVDGVPVSESSFGRDARFPVRESCVSKLLGGVPVSVRDASSDADLDAIAREALAATDVIAAGSGGLARFWARLLAAAQVPRERTAVRQWLLVCGSLHPRSRAQAEHARSLGIHVETTSPEPAGDPAGVARELAGRTPELIEKHGVDGLIVFGGDTALSVIDALGCTRLASVGEAAPGVPVSVAFTPEREITVVTKAGGFGSDNVVEQIVEALRPAA